MQTIANNFMELAQAQHYRLLLSIYLVKAHEPPNHYSNDDNADYSHGTHTAATAIATTTATKNLAEFIADIFQSCVEIGRTTAFTTTVTPGIFTATRFIPSHYSLQ